MTVEKRFRCPFCRERISMVLDVSIDGEQAYVEDCEVCCKPIEIRYDARDLELVLFSAGRSDGFE